VKNFHKLFVKTILSAGLVCTATAPSIAQPTIDFPIVKLRSLDKTTARTMTFEADVGSTVKFGEIYIKVRACRKAPEMEKPESASFLQVWEVNKNKETGEEKSEWVFSGWMFASSPGLSSMDHPIYDVWVLDCIQKKDELIEDEANESREGEGQMNEDQAPAQPIEQSSAQKEVEATPSNEDANN
tara:strand:+ start:776 stop:1330 length:555 start_codon:yes stop_codon:yes gene_type:complete